MRDFPFPLPNGWFSVGYADRLAPGEVRALRYFDRDLVLFRTESGQAAVADAFCPHLGANLGYGGVVVGESIRCPFHHWRYGVDGACVEVPYADKIPSRARLVPWPVCETLGMLWVWHHAEAAAPDWEVPTAPEFGHEDWTEPRRFRWRIRTRNQEMGENAVDRAHFRYVHGTQDVPESEVHFEGPLLHSVQSATLATPRGEVQGGIDSQTYGFGCSFIRFSGICEMLQIASVTPIDLEHVDVRFQFILNRREGSDPDSGVGGAIIQDIVKQMNEDIPIWEQKEYRERPVLCDGDGPIGPFRRWSRQFYSSA